MFYPEQLGLFSCGHKGRVGRFDRPFGHVEAVILAWYDATTRPPVGPVMYVRVRMPARGPPPVSAVLGTVVLTASRGGAGGQLFP